MSKGTTAVQAGAIYCREELAARTPAEHCGADQERGRSPQLGFEGKWGFSTAYKLFDAFGWDFGWWRKAGTLQPSPPLCHCLAAQPWAHHLSSQSLHLATDPEDPRA